VPGTLAPSARPLHVPVLSTNNNRNKEKARSTL